MLFLDSMFDGQALFDDEVALSSDMAIVEMNVSHLAFSAGFS
jgi:hypothetical protein